MSVKVSGAEVVKSKFAKKVGEIKGKMTEQTLTAIGFTGMANAKEITPVDTANLINSEFSDIQKKPEGMTLRVGFTAFYGAYVHEMPGTLKGQPRAHFGKTREGVEFGGGTGRGKYWDPKGEPQFLRKGFERDGKDVIDKLIKEGYS